MGDVIDAKDRFRVKRLVEEESSQAREVVARQISQEITKIAKGVQDEVLGDVQQVVRDEMSRRAEKRVMEYLCTLQEDNMIDFSDDTRVVADASGETVKVRVFFGEL